MKRLSVIAAALAVGAAALLAGPGSALAHAGLASSNPTDKQVLAAEPAQISMTFKQNLAPAPGSFIYVSNGGNSAAAGDSAISTSDTKSMTIPLLASSGSGQYSVFWKTTSADDGGVTFGHYVFFVGSPASADVSAAPAGVAVAVPDDATDMAVSAGGLTSVSLPVGCSMVALTFGDNTPATTVAAAVMPSGSVAIYRYDPAANGYDSFSTLGGQNTLTTVNHLDAVWLCTGVTATLMEPAV